ncbi:hepatocellular carcinoma-associated antigen 59-domain-containing protein [Daldinia sp. FL1419]|nr:hepatocellular carcinoma-associated antigen 59-domain-containing protein [Daldinia sp. FL1419]
MDSTVSESTPVPPVVFRGKKRKTYRQRAEPADDNDERAKSVETPRLEGTPTASDTPGETKATTPIQGEDTEGEEKGLSVAEVLRLRNARKARLGGVKFGAGNSHGSNDVTTAMNGTGDGLDDLSLMIREEENKVLDIAAGVKKRFAPQTGMAAELVNKHMEEYIEAELAKRHNAVALTSSLSSSNATARSSNHPPQSTPITAIQAPRPEQQNRALQGQLMEIDLGDEARSRNEALTERAARRMRGEAVDDDESSQSGRPKKVRLGRDGKPWRSRNRRNSDDIKRDQLVEEILRESRLDVYEAPTAPPTTDPDAPDDRAADDRIAEEFRREFMDAMAERQQKRKKPANAPAGSGAGGAGKGGAAADEDVLKGPKLGGSRNVRAAMRNLLLEKAKEAKGKGR